MPTDPLKTASALPANLQQLPAQHAQPVRADVAPSGASAAAATQRLSKDVIQSAVVQIQKYLTDSGRTINFQVDESSGLSVVTVRDAETGDVIRQIPNEETLHMAQLLKEGNGLTGHAITKLTV